MYKSFPPVWYLFAHLEDQVCTLGATLLVTGTQSQYLNSSISNKNVKKNVGFEFL